MHPAESKRIGFMNIDPSLSGKSLLRHSILVFAGLTVLLYFAFYNMESGDKNTVIFGTVLYLPYVLLLTAYNSITLVLIKFWTGPSGLLKVMAPLFPLIIWMLIAKGSISVRFWELGIPEMAWILCTLGLLNATLLVTPSPKA